MGSLHWSVHSTVKCCFHRGPGTAESGGLKLLSLSVCQEPGSQGSRATFCLSPRYQPDKLVLEVWKGKSHLQPNSINSRTIQSSIKAHDKALYMPGLGKLWIRLCSTYVFSYIVSSSSTQRLITCLSHFLWRECYVRMRRQLSYETVFPSQFSHSCRWLLQKMDFFFLK